MQTRTQGRAAHPQNPPWISHHALQELRVSCQSIDNWQACCGRSISNTLSIKEKGAASLNHMEHMRANMKGGKRPVAWKCDIHGKMPSYKQADQRKSQAKQPLALLGSLGLCWLQLSSEQGRVRAALGTLCSLLDQRFCLSCPHFFLHWNLSMHCPLHFLQEVKQMKTLLKS